MVIDIKNIIIMKLYNMVDKRNTNIRTHNENCSQFVEHLFFVTYLYGVPYMAQ